MAKYTLRERLAHKSTLDRAYIEVTRRASPDSAGPDGVTIDAFRRSFKSELGRLRSDLKSGRYLSSLGHAVAIPKDKKRGIVAGNVRPITVYNIRDRIIHRAISNLIWPHVRDQVHSDVSFGGIRSVTIRKRSKDVVEVKKNVRAAAARILTLRRDGYEYTFESDIVDFFPSIDKSRLMSILTEALAPDDSLLDILKAAIETDVVNMDAIEARGLSELWDPSVGVPQGGVLSPLLANLYLADFDREMTKRGFALIRYVDDFVVMCKSHEEAISAYSVSRELLSGMGLTIHPLDQQSASGKIKTRILSDYSPFEFLGLRLNKRTVQPATKKIEDLKARVQGITHVRLGEQTLVKVVNRLNHVLGGWTAAYAFCDVPPRLLEQIDHFVRENVASWMASYDFIRNRNSLTTKKCDRIGIWRAVECKIEPVSREVQRIDSQVAHQQVGG